MNVSGRSPDGKFVEIAELPTHPWFLAVQFHPEFQSQPLTPHPLFASFVEAAHRHKTGQLDTANMAAVTTASRGVARAVGSPTPVEPRRVDLQVQLYSPLE